MIRGQETVTDDCWQHSTKEDIHKISSPLAPSHFINLTFKSNTTWDRMEYVASAVKVEWSPSVGVISATSVVLHQAWAGITCRVSCVHRAPEVRGQPCCHGDSSGCEYHSVPLAYLNLFFFWGQLGFQAFFPFLNRGYWLFPVSHVSLSLYTVKFRHTHRDTDCCKNVLCPKVKYNCLSLFSLCTYPCCTHTLYFKRRGDEKNS